MVSVRRTISLICALALTGTGVFLFFYLLLYAPTFRWPLLIGGALAGFFGLYWLWVDFINVNTDPSPER